MVKKILFSAIIVSSYFVAPQVTLADGDFKVATIDVNKLINNLPESKAKKIAFDKEQKAFQRELKAKQDKIAELEKKFKASGENPQSADATALRNAIKEYETTASEKGQKLKQDFLKANKELSDKVLKVVNAYAKSQKYTLVLDKNLSATSPLLYGDDSVDITDIIAKKLN